MQLHFGNITNRKSRYYDERSDLFSSLYVSEFQNLLFCSLHTAWERITAARALLEAMLWRQLWLTAAENDGNCVPQEEFPSPVFLLFIFICVGDWFLSPKLKVLWTWKYVCDVCALSFVTETMNSERIDKERGGGGGMRGNILLQTRT